MVAQRRRRPSWWDRVREVLRLLVGLTGEVVRLINAIRSIR